MWSTTLTTMVRHLVNDTTETYEFSDDKVKTSIIVAGILVSQEYNFSTSYTFDLSPLDISPDPTVTATYDGPAVALISLKASCMLTMDRYQGAVKDGIGVSISEGDSSVSTTGQFKGYSDILSKGPCASYQSLLKKLSGEKSMNIGRAVMTPFSHTDMLAPYGYVRDFFDSFRSR